MRHIRLAIIGFICALGSFSSFAQAINPLEIVKADTVFTIDSTYWGNTPQNLVFGGISGMESMPDGRLLLVSDRQTPSKLAENQYTWGFVLNTETNRIDFTYKFYGAKNLESLRYFDGTLWFSYEDDFHTGIGYIDAEGFPVVLVEESMTDSPHTMDNRGIEGIAVGEDLWYAFESSTNTTHIVKWQDRNRNDEQWYAYPLDKRSCLSPDQPLNGSLGNGISEILDIPGERNRLLVMERCFNGKYTYIKIFEAYLEGDVFNKRKIFDWSPETRFNNKPIKPDNMEGMTWADIDAEGKKSLYIISDDNHNPKYQRTILLKLQEQ